MVMVHHALELDEARQRVDHGTRRSLVLFDCLIRSHKELNSAGARALHVVAPFC